MQLALLLDKPGLAEQNLFLSGDESSEQAAALVFSSSIRARNKIRNRDTDYDDRAALPGRVSARASQIDRGRDLYMANHLTKAAFCALAATMNWRRRRSLPSVSSFTKAGAPLHFPVSARMIVCLPATATVSEQAEQFPTRFMRFFQVILVPGRHRF